MADHEIDKHHVLEEGVFTYRVSKDNKVFISWHGKQIMIIKSETARKFLRRIEGLDHLEAQLLMAKITGNFKHGNER
jgi:hypothetical protein